MAAAAAPAARTASRARQLAPTAAAPPARFAAPAWPLAPPKAVAAALVSKPAARAQQLTPKAAAVAPWQRRGRAATAAAAAADAAAVSAFAVAFVAAFAAAFAAASAVLMLPGAPPRGFRSRDGSCAETHAHVRRGEAEAAASGHDLVTISSVRLAAADLAISASSPVASTDSIEEVARERESVVEAARERESAALPVVLPEVLPAALPVARPGGAPPALSRSFSARRWSISLSSSASISSNLRSVDCSARLGSGAASAAGTGFGSLRCPWGESSCSVLRWPHRHSPKAPAARLRRKLSQAAMDRGMVAPSA